MNKFKIGDKVYFPPKSTKVLTICRNSYISEYPIVALADSEKYPWSLTIDGKVYVDDALPSLFHATPENKAKLEDFYGIPFEPAPSKPTSREIIKAMLARGDKYVCCWVSDHEQEPDHRCVCYLISGYDGDEASFPYLLSRGGCWKYATPFNPRTGETITELPE